MYSAASMFLRSLSAEFQSCFSSGSSLTDLSVLVRAISAIYFLDAILMEKGKAVRGGSRRSSNVRPGTTASRPDS